MACIDREKVLAVLAKRFPAAPSGDVAAAANAIVGLDAEYDLASPGEIRRFECEFRTKEFALRHVVNGDLRLYYRTVRPR